MTGQTGYSSGKEEQQAADQKEGQDGLERSADGKGSMRRRSNKVRTSGSSRDQIRSSHVFMGKDWVRGLQGMAGIAVAVPFYCTY